MDFIGGGAKNYSQFLKFLGDKKVLGSPFQMNFVTEPSGSKNNDMEPLPEKPKACNDTDKAYQCSCIDCAASCPELPKVTQEEYCYVGVLPCLSFAVILVYSVFLLLVIIAISGHIAYEKQQKRKSERLQLLQDAALSDDEDEGDLVRNAGILDRAPRTYRLNSIFDAAFSKLGGVCARFPALTISASILVVGLLSIGWINFAIERDPVRLWVSPTSAAAQEKAFFDANFGPFYRAEQAFLVNDTQPSGPGPVLDYDTLAWWFDVEGRVHRLRSIEYGLALDDLCYKPTGDACVIQSLSGWFGGSLSGVDRNDWKDRIQECADSPGRIDCLPAFQQPLQPGMILGGYNTTDNVLDAQSLVVTWVVNNHEEGSEGEAKAKDWEDSFKDLFKAIQDEAEERGLRVSFTTEISLEEELNKSTNTDAKIVAISYVIMFIYASLALGSAAITSKSLLKNPANALVQSKFTLGVVGILIVLMSVSASIGLFSAAGVKVTLIIAEVIPFLVLAIGVDNIFLICHEFERVNVSHPDEEIDERIAKALGRMGPSILFSATTETVAFALGCFVGMPAVKNFAAYAAGAVVINALLQVTMFVSVLALNQKRVESLRADCFPCLTVSQTSSVGIPGGQLYEGEEDGLLQRFIRKTYATRLLGKKTKVGIVIGFLALFTAGLALMPEVALGLDQRIAIPSDSYLIDYFNDLYAYFGQGPPVYFVTRNLNVTERTHQRELCGRFYSCEKLSMAFQLEQESKRPEVSHISGSAASWIDDFFYWLNPENDGCCVEKGEACFENREPPWNLTLSGMPEGEEFIHYLQKWIDSPTDADCPLGGKAPYSNALVIDAKRTTTPATHFRTTHTPLRSQEDFINSYASARRIADNIAKENGIDVFPYSKFYIFFDQYATIIRLTGTLLGSAVAIIFVISAILLGSIATAAVVTLTVVMIEVDIIGSMAVAGVSLNAVSLVNLVICVGIGVEFCAHVARAFMFPSKSVLEKAKIKFRGKDARAWTALVNVGGSVFSGITVTKLLGVIVLAFTRSKIFEIYYFRVWLALVIFAATHALVFLPVALSFVGGEGKQFLFPKCCRNCYLHCIGYIDTDSDGGLEEDLATRRYRALIPEDEYDSDDE
jgi:Niemann-Pick C1 protein